MRFASLSAMFDKGTIAHYDSEADAYIARRVEKYPDQLANFIQLEIRPGADHDDVPRDWLLCNAVK